MVPVECGVRTFDLKLTSRTLRTSSASGGNFRRHEADPETESAETIYSSNVTIGTPLAIGGVSDTRLYSFTSCLVSVGCPRRRAWIGMSKAHIHSHPAGHS
jgi:hypothetical protein